MRYKAGSPSSGDCTCRAAAADSGHDVQGAERPCDLKRPQHVHAASQRREVVGHSPPVDGDASAALHDPHPGHAALPLPCSVHHKSTTLGMWRTAGHDLRSVDYIDAELLAKAGKPQIAAVAAAAPVA